MARILIIDDENNIRLMLRLALQADDHEVETAADGMEGLDKYGDGAPWDLILLDQRMPGMEGLDVLREMKKRKPGERVVMITAFATIDLAASALEAGATDFLRKPFTMDMLRASVRAALKDSASFQVPSEMQPAVARASAASINGFRIEEQVTAVRKNGKNDTGKSLTFQVRQPDGNATLCTVNLPAYITELVKAHADREEIPDDELFWRWLAEEVLANYLWQHAELPPDAFLQVDEYTSNLKRWVSAVLSS